MIDIIKYFISGNDKEIKTLTYLQFYFTHNSICKSYYIPLSTCTYRTCRCIYRWRRSCCRFRYRWKLWIYLGIFCFCKRLTFIFILKLLFICFICSILNFIIFNIFWVFLIKFFILFPWFMLKTWRRLLATFKNKLCKYTCCDDWNKCTPRGY